ncbi:MAG: zinc ribbon domain-containing protein [Planctomycetes bacterium]|nr:zinc ribbon domain-containing protein [Planctomycetota bacterium]
MSTIEDSDDRQPCPVCGESIKKSAKVCRHCGEKLTPKGESQGDSTGGLIPYKNPPALIAYYCGLFSLLACLIPIFLPLPVVAVVAGIKGLKKAKAEPQVKGQVHAWIGVIGGGLCGLVGLVTTVGIVIALLSKP